MESPAGTLGRPTGSRKTQGSCKLNNIWEKKSPKDPSFLTATMLGASFLMLKRSNCLSTGLLQRSMAGRTPSVAAGRKKRKGRLVST